MELSQSQIDKIADAVVARLAQRLSGNINRAPSGVEKSVSLRLTDIEPKGEWRNGKGVMLHAKDPDGRTIGIMVNYATADKSQIDALLAQSNTWQVVGDIVVNVSEDGKQYRKIFVSQITAGTPEAAAANSAKQPYNDGDVPF